ncbi:hypothetical protein DVH24_036877 [Malus domestica]|uniref:VDE lipocalin domain-containing protein n=1 Tax=Malus domestica TaxID=3750 RepID=A0A498IGP3_MALDO|nr:hypothetical protein DVH24_036877 [Malus domestica]
MALAGRSVFLSHKDGIGNACIRLGLKNDERLQKGRMVGFHVVVKFSSQRRNFSGLGSKRSSLLSSRMEEAFSERSTKTSEPEMGRAIDLMIEEVLSVIKEWSQLHFMKVAGLLLCTFMVMPSANAVDALKTCACLLKECRSWLIIRHKIKCGDLFENKVVDEFNECAVSRKKCVPMKSDVGEFPIPDPAALVKSFDMSKFNGKWFITSGLNPTFDVFDCQLHEFHTESSKLVGNLSWRIKTPDGGFFTRSAEQKFVQDPNQPGILYNHDNEYLHYQDDWYILSSKIENTPDDYIFVYYRGRNDAWDGYGGAVVYTRSSVLPESIVPELERAAKSVGRDFSKFIRTDNTCGPEPPLVERLEKTIEEGERTIIEEVKQIEGEVEKVEQTELTLFQKLLEGFNVLKQDEENFLRGLSKEEMDLLSELKMEAGEVGKLFGKTLPLRKLR